MTNRTRISLVALALAVSFVAFLVFGGAGTDQETVTDFGSYGAMDGDASSELGSPAPQPTSDAVMESAQQPQVGTGDSLAPPSGREDFDAGERQIIRSGWLAIEVEDVRESTREIELLAEEYDGVVTNSQLGDRRGDILAGYVVVRVPNADMADFMDDAEALGLRPLERRISSDDVTDTLTDLDARIRNLSTYEEQLLEVLEEVREGTNTTRLFEVFAEVNQVRIQIESLEAQRQDLENRVAFSSVTIEMEAEVPAEEEPEEPEEPEERERPDFALGDTFEDAWFALVSFAAVVTQAVVWFAVVGVPGAIFGVLVGLVIRTLYRVLMRRRSASIDVREEDSAQDRDAVPAEDDEENWD